MDYMGILLRYECDCLNIFYLADRFPVHEENSVNDKTVEVVDAAVQAAKLIAWPVALAETVQLGVVKVKSSKEIRDQQYRCGVVMFYMKELADFLE